MPSPIYWRQLLRLNNSTITINTYTQLTPINYTQLNIIQTVTMASLAVVSTVLVIVVALPTVAVNPRLPRRLLLPPPLRPLRLQRPIMTRLPVEVLRRLLQPRRTTRIATVTITTLWCTQLQRRAALQPPAAIRRT